MGSLLLLLTQMLTHGCTMVAATTEDTDSDTPDTDLDILFGDVRRGLLRLSPLLRPKPIPGTTMVLATMVDSDTTDVTMVVTTVSDTEDISGDKFGHQPISAITSLPCLMEQIQVTKIQNQLPTAFAKERLPCAK